MGIEPTCPDFRRDTPDLKSGSPTSELSTSNFVFISSNYLDVKEAGLEDP